MQVFGVCVCDCLCLGAPRIRNGTAFQGIFIVLVTLRRALYEDCKLFIDIVRSCYYTYIFNWRQLTCSTACTVMFVFVLLKAELLAIYTFQC